MLVNNELGTLQPVEEVARGLGAAADAGGPRPPGRPHFHVDADAGARCVLRVRPRARGRHGGGVGAQVVHGPKGTGALWVRAGARLVPSWDGGRQERGLRSGTENVAGAVGLGRAAALAVAAQEAGAAIERERDRLEREILAVLADAAPGARLTVTGAPRAPHISSLAFPGLPAEPLLHALEARDVYVSAGSACASRTRGPSAVLKAIGVDDRTAVLRFSLARTTTPADVDAAVEALLGAVEEISALANAGARR